MKTLIPRYARIAQFCFAIGFVLLLFSCNSKDKAGEDEDAKVVSQTPVTVTTVESSALTDYIDLNATSTILQKNYVKANANGYIHQVNAQLGQNVSRGQVLFTIKTKESQAQAEQILVAQQHDDGIPIEFR